MIVKIKVLMVYGIVVVRKDIGLRIVVSEKIKKNEKVERAVDEDNLMHVH